MHKLYFQLLYSVMQKLVGGRYNMAFEIAVIMFRFKDFEINIKTDEHKFKSVAVRQILKEQFFELFHEIKSFDQN